MAKLSIGHIINPVKVDSSSDLYLAQPIVFESMKIAKEYANDELEVSQYAAFFQEDEDIVPPEFNKTKLLKRSILDLQHFKIKRKLPFIKDILGRLYKNCKADYFIYTNADIGLMPYFYVSVKKIIEKGYDGFLINRRTLSKNYDSLRQLPFIYADIGETHPGHDCFIFKRDIYKKFILGTTCIGAQLFARSIMSNMIAYSHNYNVFEEFHLTFHIGNDQVWKKNDSNEYYYHNVNEVMKILKKLSKRKNVQNEDQLLDFYKSNVIQVRKHAEDYHETDYLKCVPDIDDIST